MSKEQNEVLEQQRYLLERRMYRLDPAPPKLPMLNKLAQDACQRYGLPGAAHGCQASWLLRHLLVGQESSADKR